MPIKIVADKTAGRRRHVQSQKRPQGGRRGAHPVKRTGKQFGGGFNQPLGGVGGVGGAGAPIRPVGFKHGKRAKKK